MAIGSPQWMYNSGSEYELDQSLRFDDGRNTNLERLPVSAGNRKTWTYSCWVKRGNQTGNSQQLLSATNDQIIFRGSSQVIRMMNNALSFNLISTPVYRDNSAWYHIVVAFDTTQSTASNRIKLYVNGEQVTSFSTATYPSQNDNTAINNATTHYIGRYAASGSEYLDGYLAEVNFIDGQALTPADFGETGDYGEWKPIEYSGSYGTNGFYLPFKQDYTVEGFSTVTYSGTGAEQYIGGTGFQPDLTWNKKRSGVSSHNLFDAVRGATKRLYTTGTGAEDTPNQLTAFNTDGFTLSSGNDSGQTYVAWNWDMGGSNATNTDGSITSTVRANPTYGQSIVSYSGNGTNNATVGHGLSSAPELVIIKRRDAATNWNVGADAIGWANHLYLNTTSAQLNGYNPITGQASTLEISNDSDVNNSSGTYIAYCFHSVTGYSKFGSYTGSGSTGNAVTTGFEPAFVMFKRTDTANDWDIRDNVRSPSNPNDLRLFPSQSGAEGSGDNAVDFTSTGFTLKSGDGRTNASGGTYIYMAFADKREYAYWLDQSGNNNDWTSNNLTESDISVDSPTNNFATLNPLDSTNTTFSEGNLDLVVSSSSQGAVRGTLGASTGKWYWEVLVGSDARIMPAISNSDSDTVTDWAGSKSGSWAYWKDGVKYNNGTSINYGATYTTGDIISVALDLDAGTVAFYKNGVSQGTAYSSLPTDTYFPLFGHKYGQGVANFGQDSSFAGNKTAQGNQDGNGIGDFYYTPPTGFLALCTKNLPDVDVVPSEHFNTILYTGTGSSASHTIGFRPNLVWGKKRGTNAQNHWLINDVGDINKRMSSDNTDAEASEADGTTFDTNGFTTASNDLFYNNGSPYVVWAWKGNGTGTAVSNTNGSITSTVSANVDAGFSIVSYTGNGTGGATIGHGLSKAPELFIIKNRTSSGYQWPVYTSTTGASAHLTLESTNAVSTNSVWFNSTAPTSSVMSLGTTARVNRSSDDYIAYCFHSVDGYSKVGSYTGNGNADGTFVYTGFRPAFVMIKPSSRTGHWHIVNNESSPSNVVDKVIFANDSAAEYTDPSADCKKDLLSNGFKIRTTDDNTNENGATYIYIAFAETPFKNSNAR